MGSGERISIWCSILFIISASIFLVEDGNSQVAPFYGDPDIGVSLSGYFETTFQENKNIAHVTGSVTCLFSTNTPDGARVRIDLLLEDQFEYSNSETMFFENGAVTEKDFNFRYFIIGEFLEGEKFIVTVSTHWEYLSPEEGSGDLAPITNSVTIGPFGKLEVARVKPQGIITLEKDKWRTIEVMIQNHGNTEERVMISVLENPSRFEVDLKKGWVMVGPFGEFPHTFFIRCTENRDIDSYLTLKIDIIVDGNVVEASHRINVEMGKEEEGIDLSGTAVFVIATLFLVAFFGGMVIFWLRLMMIRKKNQRTDEYPGHPDEYQG
jgi:hypothetical protein